jgi:hypothetical protein
MATPPEIIAIWILEALEAEAVREPDKRLRRFDREVLGEVMGAHGLQSADIDRGINFLVGLRAIGAFARDGGTVSYPFPTGEQILAEHRAEQSRIASEKRKKNEWTLDRRLVLYGILIAALISILVVVLQK